MEVVQGFPRHADSHPYTAATDQTPLPLAMWTEHEGPKRTQQCISFVYENASNKRFIPLPIIQSIVVLSRILGLYKQLACSRTATGNVAGLDAHIHLYQGTLEISKAKAYTQSIAGTAR